MLFLTGDWQLYIDEVRSYRFLAIAASEVLERQFQNGNLATQTARFAAIKRDPKSLG